MGEAKASHYMLLPITISMRQFDTLRKLLGLYILFGSRLEGGSDSEIGHMHRNIGHGFGYVGCVSCAV